MKIHCYNNNYLIISNVDDKNDILKKIKYNQLNKIEYNYMNDSNIEIIIEVKGEEKSISSDYDKYYYNLLKRFKDKITKNKKSSPQQLINLFGLSNIDYIFVLTKEQMPIVSMCRKKEMIPNEPIKFDKINDEHDTILELITSYELLGCYTIIKKMFIDELKDNGVNELELKNGEKKKIEELDGRKVIFICEELIEELSNNIKKVKTYDDLRNYFKLDNQVLIDEIRNFFCDENLLKEMVLYHELGHAVFEPLNIDDLYINERQANYYASICFEGKYDDMIEIYNNKISKHYKNPLLLKHEKDQNYEKEVSKLYGEICC